MFWYEEEVTRLERYIQNHDNLSSSVVFYGSSSIRMWDNLSESFTGLPVLNLGFGGSTLAACSWYFERIMQNVSAKALIIYAGDNDLGDNRHPEEVFIYFKQLLTQIHQRFGNIPIGFMSIKPSYNRWHFIEQIKFTNKIIQTDIAKMPSNVTFIDIFYSMLDAKGYPKMEYLLPDGLHISKEGYACWTICIQEQFVQRYLQQ